MFTFPTAGGERTVRTPYTGVFGGLSAAPLQGPLGGRITSRNWTAEAHVTPLQGDCVARPLTRVRDVGVFTAR